MKFVAGIDGGQSSTVAVIGDERGRIVGRGRAGPADEVGAASESTRLRDALAEALRVACDDARLPGGTKLVAVVAGISGYDGHVRGRAPELPAERVELLHDAPVAHAGALGGAPGVIVVAGTGSAVYATGAARPWSAGGWGYLFGDEGSAFWVAREALAEMMRAEDGGVRDSQAATAACEFFGLPSIRTIARSFYGGELTRARLAAFAPAAMQFPAFRALAERGAQHLVRLVVSALEAGAAPAVAATGGMFEDAALRRYFGDTLARAAPGASLVAPKYDPSVGALLLAYRLAGFEAFETIER